MIYDLLSEVNASINIIIDYNWKLISHVLYNVSYYLTSHHRFVSYFVTIHSQYLLFIYFERTLGYDMQ